MKRIVGNGIVTLLILEKHHLWEILLKLKVSTFLTL